ncbi:MAG: recombinase family protein [Candidatus Sedimenticola sp. 6PFRAG7]
MKKILRAAIYARKSNDDNDRTEDAKSITRQVKHGIEYAESKGWIVSDDLIFIDDGISGAEFNKRSGLSELRCAVDKLDVVVMSELSRLGRDSTRTTAEIVNLTEAGKRIFFYLTDEEQVADDATTRLMLYVKSYTAEVEREKASQRVSDTLRKKFKDGHVVGGSVYGYDIIPVLAKSVSGEEIKSHSEYQINECEAAVVNGIFEMYNDGFGLKKITKILNGDTKQEHLEARKRYLNNKAPEPSKRSSGVWTPSAVRDILHRKTYLGLSEYGRKKRIYVGGSPKRVANPAYDKIEQHRLQIVPDELGEKVTYRLEEQARKYEASRGGKLPFSRSVGTANDSKYLLSGLCACSECNHSYVSLGGSTGSGKNRRPKYRYGCTARANKGNTVCSNDHKVDLDELDTAVLSSIEKQVLSRQAVEYMLDKAEKLIAKQQKEKPDQSDQIASQLKSIEQELMRLVKMVAMGVESETLGAEIMGKEKEKKFLEEESVRITALKEVNSFDRAELRDHLTKRLKSFKGLMSKNVHGARKALQALLVEKITIRPITINGKKTVSFEGRTTVGRITANDDEDDHIGLGTHCRIKSGS